MRYLIVLILLYAPPVVATPVVSNVGVSGTEITISGSGFSNKSVAAPWRWENFESGGSPYLWASPTVTTTNLRGNSTHHLISCNSEYSGVKFPYNEDSRVLAGGEVYASTWFWIPEDFAWVETPTDQIKIMRSYNGGGVPNALLVIRNVPYQSLMITDEYGGSPSIYADGGASNIIRGQWNRIEWFFRLSTGVGVADGVHVLYVNGKQLVNVSNRISLSEGRSTDIVRHTQEFTMPNTCRVSQDSHRPHYDDIYVDFTRARVEISDQPEWDHSVIHHREIQIPTAWTDTEITVDLNTGAFTEGQTAYLYVVDADGAVNANGYAVTIGATGVGNALGRSPFHPSSRARYSPTSFSPFVVTP